QEPSRKAEFPTIPLTTLRTPTAIIETASTSCLEMARCAASRIASRPRHGLDLPHGLVAKSSMRMTIDLSLYGSGTDGMKDLPKPLASGGRQPAIGSRRPRRFYLLFCVGGGALVLVIACWLWLTQGPELATLRGHRGIVRSLALSPDGALLASGG